MLPHPGVKLVEVYRNNTGRKTQGSHPSAMKTTLSLYSFLFRDWILFMFLRCKCLNNPSLCYYYYFMSINNKLISELVMILDTIYILMTQKFISLARTISWIIDIYVQLPGIPKISKFKTKLLIFFFL